MNNKIQIKKERAARGTAIEAQTSEPRFPGFLTNPRWRFAIASVASLALAGGCCDTQRSAHAKYSPLPSTAYAGPAPEKRAESQANIVVPLHQESVTVGKREVDAGSVRLKKIVTTETVNQPIELRHEEVVIDREAGTGEAASHKVLAKAFQEEETVIPLKREEAVIEKRVVPAGQIVVRTRTAAEQSSVQAQVRREDIDFAQLNNAQNVIIGKNARNSASKNAAVGGAETPGGQASGAANNSEQTEFITDPATLPPDNAATFYGRRVQFRDMKIRKVLGERLVVISATDDGRPLYVVCKENKVTAQPGDVVVITGRIKQKAGSPTETGLDVKGAQLLMAQPYYIEVEKIETAPK